MYKAAKNINLVKTTETDKLDYAAICIGCGSIFPFSVDAHISIILEDGTTNDVLNRFKCRASNTAHQLYFICDECMKLTAKSINTTNIPQVLVIPKDLALATKIIIDNGVSVKSMAISDVYVPSINLSDGKPEFLTILPIFGGIEITGKNKANNVYNLMESIIEKDYNGIFGCNMLRVVNQEEAHILYDDDEEERSLDELNTPEDEQLFGISVYSKVQSNGNKIKSEDEVGYDSINDANDKFIKFISTFAEALVQMMSKVKDSE